MNKSTATKDCSDVEVRHGCWDVAPNAASHIEEPEILEQNPTAGEAEDAIYGCKDGTKRAWTLRPREKNASLNFRGDLQPLKDLRRASKRW